MKYVFPQAARYCAAVALCIVAFTALSMRHADAHAPRADTRIEAQAELSYIVPGTHHRTVLASNLLLTVILPVEALTLDGDQHAQVLPGQSIAVPLVLVNTGNVTAHYAFSLQPDGAFEPRRVRLYNDINANGIADDGPHWIALQGTANGDHATTSLAAGERLSLLLLAEIPATASGTAQLRLSAVTRAQQVSAQAIITIDTTRGALVKLTAAAQPASARPGDAIALSLHATNMGGAGAAPIRDIDATPIEIDGVPQAVLLLSNAMPAGTRYVPGSLQTTDPTARLLVRTSRDGRFSYRTDLSSAAVVEVAVALPVGLERGASSNASFGIRVDDDFPATVLEDAALAFYGGGSQPGVQRAVSNRARVAIGELDVPDLLPQLSATGEFVIGREVGLTLRARNAGTGATHGAITLVGVLPPGMQLLAAASGGAPDDWHCTAQQRRAECVTRQRVAPGALTAPVELRATIDATAVPAGQTSARLVSTARVSGGGEPAHLAGNNSATYEAEVTQGATLSGRAWIDADHSGQYDVDEQPLAGWRAQLLDVSDEQQSGIRLSSEVISDDNGVYRFTGILAGVRYALRVLSPDGKLYGVPQDGSPSAAGLRHRAPTTVPDMRLGLLRYPAMQAARAYRDQNLALLPNGIVYDALTREPVAGATITLRPPHGALDRARDLMGGNDAVSITDDHGRYFIALTPDAPAGLYRIGIDAAGYAAGASRLIPARAAAAHATPGVDVRIARQAAVPAAGSKADYHNAFVHEAGGGRFYNNHIPIDPVLAAHFALVLTNLADRRTVELIDFVNYTLTLKQHAGGTLPGFQITDTLPQGFKYVNGSARLQIDGRDLPVPEPVVHGSQLSFSLPDRPLPVSAMATLRFRARVGANAREHAEATSRASASAGSLTSNQAKATVKVVGGVFSSDAFVAGKVFFDCDRDGVQGAGELGVPGVRIYLENGTFTETDIDGKYSLYGLQPLTHVLKLDAASVPPGARALPISSRHAGNGDSRFLDLHNGELGRGDFALSCPPDAAALVTARRRKLETSATPSEIEAAVKRRLESQYAEPIDGEVRARAAAGIIDGIDHIDQTTASVRATEAVADAAMVDTASPQVTPSMVGASSPKAHSPVIKQALEKLLPGFDAQLAFVDLKDGAVMPSRQVSVRVKGRTGVQLTLSVNDTPIERTRLAQRSELASRGVAGWEYLGVALRPGTNRMTIRETLPDGSRAAQRSITVIAPGDFAQLHLQMPQHPVADGITAVAIAIAATDSAGHPVSARLPITLSASAGRWSAHDVDPATPGMQVFIENGSGSFTLSAPSVPTEVVIRARSGSVSTERRLAFAPALRPMIAAGLAEGIFTVSNRSIESIGGRDSGFERELTHLSRTWDGGGQSAALRTAFFLKGKIRGDYLLTASFDSEKDVKDRLFRDIEPDRYYPVYGDSAVRGFDAQSTGRLYVRIDKQHSYLLYGDFQTGSNRDVRQLTQYDRAVTGLTHHYEDGRINADLFASHDSLVQQVLELPGKGFGPYVGMRPDYVENSERVEIITRDRDQRGSVLTSRTLSRFADYEIEALSGHLMLKDPLPRIDPATQGWNSIRITYETDGNGDKAWLIGGAAQLRVAPGLTLGAVAVTDRNPAEPRQLRGLTALAELGRHTSVAAEYAHTDTAKRGTGAAARIELRHESARVKAQAQLIHSGSTFDNLSAPVSAGRFEARGRIEYRLDARNQLGLEVLRSQDNRPDGGASISVTGALFGLEHNLTQWLTLELGTRLAQGTARDLDDAAEIDLLTARTKLTTLIPGLPNASLYGEYEQDVRSSSKRALALGGAYRLGDASRIYARHELVSSLGSIYELNGAQRTLRTIAGIDSEYMQDGRVYSEYRQGGAIAGRDAQAAFGLRNGWQLSPGLRLGTTFERTRSLGSQRRGETEATALTGSLEYLASARWKGSTTLELRRANNEDSVLQTVGVAVKLSPDWTLLGRSAAYRVVGRGQQPSATTLRMRQRLGAAYRQTARNTVNALAYYEHRLETGRTLSQEVKRYQAHLVSAIASVQAARNSTYSARYAAKQVTERGAGGHSSMSAQLVSGRLIHDIDARWDVGLAASLFIDNNRQRKHALGAELGFKVQKDLWLSAGYNLVGFFDREFGALAQTMPGAYFRLRYKFDENSFSLLN